MSSLKSYDTPYVSAMQCYVCVCYKACELKEKQHLTITKNDGAEEQQQEVMAAASVQCKGCKLQYYCSFKHLIADQGHRDVCRALTELQKSQNIEHPLLLNGKITKLNLQPIKSQLMLAVRVNLGYQLTSRERELIGYPAYCVVCYRLEPLTACAGCAAVFYCSSEHRCLDRSKHTKEICQTLALYYSPYRMLESNLNVDHFLQCCDLKCSDLREAFHCATGLQVDSEPWRSLEAYERFSTCSSFSGIASICLALTHISIVASPDKILSVYVLGASDNHRRYFQKMHLKFFFLHYPNVCQLDISFIGEQLEPYFEIISFNFQGHKRRIVKRTYAMTFGMFVKPYKEDPTLIMIYNSDFASLELVTERLVERRYAYAVQTEEFERDFNWRSCLLEILNTFNVPICYTSRTSMQSTSNISCLNVLARKERIAVKRAYNGKQNPFREILPNHNPCPDDNEAIIYDNNYLEVIVTSKQC